MTSVIAARLASAAGLATEGASNEAQLRHELEKNLESACRDLAIPWTPFQLERALRSGGAIRFVDVAHGAVIIEYEPPKSFSAAVGANLMHARAQAEEYAELICREEGRAIVEYALVAWDGAHINFGSFGDAGPNWDPLRRFDAAAAERLLTLLRNNGKPLVHPQLLQSWIGPDSASGQKLVPLLFRSITEASASSATTKTKLLFAEWKRLFSQVVGFQPSAMKPLLERHEISHGEAYARDPAAYLFALNTYIAIIAKLVAACSLPRLGQDILDGSTPARERLRAVEDGVLFEAAGIANMLSGDFFTWYVDDPHWLEFELPLKALLDRLSDIDFRMARKSPATTRDLFKGIYERFIPREIRHALGEFYTPDWLAEHGLNLSGWTEGEPLIDPTCGTGTFLLEAIRRRAMAWGAGATAQQLLEGLCGIDLNPLAVLAAKGSIVVSLSARLQGHERLHLPVYLADAINPASVDLFGTYSYTLHTEIGPKEFRVPPELIARPDFFSLFSRLRMLIDADCGSEQILGVLRGEFQGIGDADWTVLEQTIINLVALHEQGWNGIWCSILADRFAAGAIRPSRFVCGNPPWVRWSTLPTEYASSIQARCRSLGVFSGDAWVGGIEADVSTVVTFSVIEKYLVEGGVLGFFLPGSVFTTESSAGFRSLSVQRGEISAAALLVEDFKQIRPFDGVSNHPTFLLLRRGEVTRFPIPYRTWHQGPRTSPSVQQFASAAEFMGLADRTDELAAPVPGGAGRPWLVGSQEDQALFARVFADGERPYAARKGVTTDRSGIFWLEVLSRSPNGVLTVRNNPRLGRTPGIPQVTAQIEEEHVFPLLRGRGVKPFCAWPDETLRVLLPQRGMHGNRDLPATHPLTYSYLRRFQSNLESRGSLRRFQPGQAFYSVWSTGEYTFSPFKVLWREMGNQFAAAYIGSTTLPPLLERLVIPDHKVYFIPVDSEVEAAYLTGFLNAPTVSKSVAAYAALLSLGVSVAEYVNIPAFDSSRPEIQELADMSMQITRRQGNPSEVELHKLDKLTKALLGIE